MNLDVDKQPSASIVLSCFNKENFIGECIQSVLQQTWIDFELIIIDDGSTDRSQGIIQSFNDSRIHYYYQKNQGRSAARNAGLRIANGNYVSFLDADDLFLPNKLLVQITFLERHPEFGMVVGRPTRIYETGELMYVYPPITREFTLEDMLISPRFPIHAPLIRKYWIDQAGYLDETLHAGEDYDYFCRMALQGCRIFRNDDLVCVYRYVPTTMSNLPDQQTEGIFSVIDKNFSYPNLPSNLMRLKNKAIADAHLNGAYRFFGAGSLDRCKYHILSGIEADPGLSRNGFEPILEKLITKIDYMDLQTFIDYYDNLTKSLSGTIQQMFQEKRTKVLEHVTQLVRVQPGITQSKQSISIPSQPHTQPRAKNTYLFIPSNDSHVHWMQPIANLLEKTGFMALSATYENADYYLKQLNLPHTIYQYGILNRIKPSIIILGNDWGPAEKQIIAEARQAGIVSVCIQEGVLDFRDPNIPRMMGADYAFLQGPRMLEYLQRKNSIVTGNPKYDVLSEQPLPEHVKVMINCNFTYGIYEDIRDEWVQNVVQACRNLGLDFFISQHPRDQGVFPADYPVIKSDAFKIKAQMGQSSILVSRFSTVIYEMAMMGRESIYFNPHGESFGIFSDDDTGGIVIVNQKDSLINGLKTALKRLGKNEKRRREFLRQHCGELDGGAARRCAEALRQIAAQCKQSIDNHHQQDQPIILPKSDLATSDNFKTDQQILNQALIKSPTDPELIVKHGNLLLQQGELEAARREFIKATFFAPNYAPAHAMLGLVYVYQKDYTKAESSLRQAQSLNPYDENVKILLEGIEHSISGSELNLVKSGLAQTMSESSNCPLVSVIVPTYNRPTTLVETLRSILNQTYSNVEIIIVNDAGQDIEHVIAPLNTRNNIRYVRHDKNKGLAAARNSGIHSAVGKYISYLDDDDLFYPEHIETLVNFLENSDYKVAYTNAFRAHQVTTGPNQFIVSQRDIPYAFDFDLDRLLINNYIPVLCIMHEKSCIDNAGYFDENMTTHEDWDLWIRLSRYYPFAHINKATCEFAWKVDGTTMSSQRVADFHRTRKIIYDKSVDLVKDKPLVITERQRLLDAGL